MMTAIPTMLDHAECFIEMKRRLGYKFTENARILVNFARFAKHLGETFVCSSTVIKWAQLSSTANQRVRVLRTICDMAEWLHAEDMRHEVPHRDALGYRSTRRPTPALMSVADIRKLLTASLQMQPSGSLNSLTWHYLFGLIASTGLRLGEALALRFDDIGPDGLFIRNSKFGKSRLVPLHETTWNALHRHLDERRTVNAASDHLFVLSSTGCAPGTRYATSVFRKLTYQAGLRKKGAKNGPTTRSLRHSFATRSIEQISCGLDPGRHMLALSTYLGHAGVTSSYWYLESTPVLLDNIAEQVEQAHATAKRRSK